MHRMSPTELFEEARLTEAIAAQTAIVDSRAGDPAERLLLCDLLAFAGDQPAIHQHLDRVTAPEVQNYLAEWRRLLAAEDLRHAGGRPQTLREPPDHVHRRLKAFDHLRTQPAADLTEWIDAADDAAPWVRGHADGRAFEGFRDADDLFGPVLEVFQGDRYIWLPVDQLRKLRLEPAEGLRDRLYWPASVWLADGSEHDVFLPTLYAGTSAHPEDGIRTGAGVDWVERNGLVRGFGSRTFLLGEDELELSEFRQIEVRGAYAG
jgi:type VI secretion system protein ImpE